ncbi:winged helix-turn-helix domain-containing protein [Streptomyces spiramenti]|uniref:Winged helix-turn-helix transcriptional regulator n=1 Tax=Streptomyces spiramenti TaxID=2720606 RepID=A0ABX1AD04_9ACTN|nr:winged helix-turn-helix domain-containing protein [Streptomyces spiramenti]NJP65079.1 winged helix-turn-helix transcriptional regulator [Streptomyces spiramenti]
MHSSTALADLTPPSGPVAAPQLLPLARRQARPAGPPTQAAVTADPGRAPLVGYLVLAPAGTDPTDLLNAVRAEFRGPPMPLTVLPVPTGAVAAPTAVHAVGAPVGAAPTGPWAAGPRTAEVRESAGIVVDRTARTVEVDGVPLDLTYLEYELLSLLVAHPHRVFTRDQLVETVWGYGPVGDRRTVDVHVARVRRKLGEYRARVVTVHRVGYKYVTPAG